MSSELKDDHVSVFYLVQKVIPLLNEKNAQHYLQEGFYRRALQIKETFLHLSELIKKNGSKNRDPYVTTETNILLNSFYVNLFGALDNLAWALHYEFDLIQGANENTRKRNSISFFKNEYIKQLKIFDEEFCDKILKYRSWHDEAKKFRDPAAHRIPLYCPPGIVTDENIEEYENAVDAFNKANYGSDPSGYMDAMRKKNSVGKFFAAFISYSENGDFLFPFEKTICEDYIPFWELSNCVLTTFQNKLTRPSTALGG